MNSPFVHAVVTSPPNSGHSLLSMGEFYPADIPCPSHQLPQLRLNILLNRCQLILKHRINLNKNCEALNTALLLFYPSKIRQPFWLAEYPAQTTHVCTFPYRRDRSWSVMSFFLLPDSPVIPAGDQLATSAVQYPPMPSDPVRVSNPWPRHAGFVTIPPTARVRGYSVNHLPAENPTGAREAREHVQRLIHSWIEEAKTVLIFVSPVQLILYVLSY
jgi:hypothetical protein